MCFNVLKLIVMLSLSKSASDCIHLGHDRVQLRGAPRDQVAQTRRGGKAGAKTRRDATTRRGLRGSEGAAQEAADGPRQAAGNVSGFPVCKVKLFSSDLQRMVL